MAMWVPIDHVAFAKAQDKRTAEWLARQVEDLKSIHTTAVKLAPKNDGGAG